MEIKVGDRVIDIWGRRGIVDMICDCELCKKRGFDEPRVKMDAGNYGYITDYDASHGFSEYYQIGNTTWPEHVPISDLVDYINEQHVIVYDASFRAYDAAKLLDVVSMK